MAQPPVSGECITTGMFFPQSHELLRLNKGKRSQQDAVDQRVHGGCRSDCKRQGQNRRGGEDPIVAERRKGLAEILHFLPPELLTTRIEFAVIRLRLSDSEG
jgi:hypothetical protein